MSRAGKLRELIDKIRREPGWTVERTRGGHYRVRSPQGGQTFLSSTTGDRKAWYPSRLHLRKIGWPY